MLTVQQGLAHMYESLLELSDRSAFNDQLSRLDEFIEDVDKEIESERLALEQSKFSDREVIATMMKSSSDNAHFARKIFKRLYETGVEQHNARVDFYHFLLAQRAEHNLDYRGGPIFDNAGDLIADLHGPDAVRIRAAVNRTISGEPPKTGGILAALRRSPLVGADLDLGRSHVEGRKIDL